MYVLFIAFIVNLICQKICILRLIFLHKVKDKYVGRDPFLLILVAKVGKIKHDATHKRVSCNIFIDV